MRPIKFIRKWMWIIDMALTPNHYKGVDKFRLCGLKLAKELYEFFHLEVK
jgi:hypothetical protein